MRSRERERDDVVEKETNVKSRVVFEERGFSLRYISITSRFQDSTTYRRAEMREREKE